MRQLVIVKKRNKGFEKKPLFVTVGKSVSKKAVERNLIKRRVRAIAGPKIKESAYGATVIIKPEARGASYAELERAIQEEMKHAGII